MKIYLAAPRDDRLSVMLKHCKYILSSYYYIAIEERMLMNETKCLQTIIKHNKESKKALDDAKGGRCALGSTSRGWRDVKRPTRTKPKG